MMNDSSNTHLKTHSHTHTRTLPGQDVQITVRRDQTHSYSHEALLPKMALRHTLSRTLVAVLEYSDPGAGERGNKVAFIISSLGVL